MDRLETELLAQGTDLNTLTETGTYDVRLPVNGPDPEQNYFVTHLRAASSLPDECAYVQIAYQAFDGAIFRRGHYQGEWTEWVSAGEGGGGFTPTNVGTIIEVVWSSVAIDNVDFEATYGDRYYVARTPVGAPLPETYSGAFAPVADPSAFVVRLPYLGIWHYALVVANSDDLLARNKDGVVTPTAPSVQNHVSAVGISGSINALSLASSDAIYPTLPDGADIGTGDIRVRYVFVQEITDEL